MIHSPLEDSKVVEVTATAKVEPVTAVLWILVFVADPDTKHTVDPAFESSTVEICLLGGD